ncbi:MAG TPA: Uma2 family endonuclease [Chitinophagaceae bacterium]|nr:Uma2 family endonuclease [Chitinophagaceae bacterium]
MNIGSIPAEWLPQYTYKDYEKWEGDWELIRGIPYAMSPSPYRRHQYIGGQFVTLSNISLRKNAKHCSCEVLYESDWIINEHTVVKPDVIIVCDIPPSDFIRIPPVLILEIFSSATRLKDRNIKFKLYEENGVKYYLMADPEKNAIEMFVLKDNRYQEIITSSFELTASCVIELDVQQLWK